MVRLPQGPTRSAPLASAAAERGRGFALGLRREKSAELKWFSSMMEAARKYGPPARPPKQAPLPETWHTRELKRILKPVIGKTLTPKRADAIEAWHLREIAKIIKAPLP
jgi:hypothetical protein